MHYFPILIIRDSRQSSLFLFASLFVLRPLANTQLGNEKPVHVMHVRIEPPSELERPAELFPPESDEALSTEFKSGRDKFDVWPFAESVCHDFFVLVWHDRAS